jgi:superfamily II DNA or RNA helicase
MISKLSNFGRRSDFIVSLVQDLISQQSDKQIMLLAHNRSLLTYIYDSIIHRKFATVGYYVGGMKQSDLKISETNQIVLATYSMAAEALDIKTLSTLIMATPKTDVTQSIGRILRVKGNNPIVIDIIDSHELFQNQWIKRKRYYKKNDYFIYNVDSDKYTNMIDTQWNISYDPSNKKTDKKSKPNCLIQI